MELLILTENRHDMVRGQVVAAMPDGHPWSERERSRPHWQIVRVIGLLPIEADALTSLRGDGQRAPVLNIDDMPAEIDRAELYRRTA